MRWIRRCAGYSFTGLHQAGASESLIFLLSLFENKTTTNLEGVRAKSWFCLRQQQQTFLSPSSLLVQDLAWTLWLCSCTHFAEDNTLKTQSVLKETSTPVWERSSPEPHSIKSSRDILRLTKTFWLTKNAPLRKVERGTSCPGFYSTGGISSGYTSVSNLDNKHRYWVLTARTMLILMKSNLFLTPDGQIAPQDCGILLPRSDGFTHTSTCWRKEPVLLKNLLPEQLLTYRGQISLIGMKLLQ